MCVTISYGDLVVEFSCEAGGWNPDIAEDMANRACKVFSTAMASAHLVEVVEGVDDDSDDEGE